MVAGVCFPLFFCLRGSFPDGVSRVLVSGRRTGIGSVFPSCTSSLHRCLSTGREAPGGLWLLASSSYLLSRTSPGQKDAHLGAQMRQESSCSPTALFCVLLRKLEPLSEESQRLSHPCAVEGWENSPTQGKKTVR